MCYWVGTKKVKNELLKRRGETLDSEIQQLVYSDFLNSDTKHGFQEHWLAFAMAKPRISGIVNTGSVLEWKNFYWSLDWRYFDSRIGQEKMLTLPLVRSETVFKRHADLFHYNRCIIPLDGYFEYFRSQKATFPYYMYPANGGLWYVAGFYASPDYRYNTSDNLQCTLLTIGANDFVSRIHNQPRASEDSRMLVILNESEAFDYLLPELTGKEVRSFFRPISNEQMSAHTVIRFQQKQFRAYINTAKVREYFCYPDLAG